MKKIILILQLTLVFLPSMVEAKWKPSFRKAEEPSALDKYVTDALSRPVTPQANGGSPGSLWSTSALLYDLARDLRASRVDDLVTIVVSDRADASSAGNSTGSRQSSVNSNITSLLGLKSAAGALPNLATLSTATSLQGQGATSRQTTLTTTLSARVVNVLPNGYLVIEGRKDTMINSERQVIAIRGVVRPSDLQPGNTVSSDRLAQLELRMNGKGVVADAIQRPNAIYRFLLGLLPF